MRILLAILLAVLIVSVSIAYLLGSYPAALATLIWQGTIFTAVFLLVQRRQTAPITTTPTILARNTIIATMALRIVGGILGLFCILYCAVFGYGAALDVKAMMNSERRNMELIPVMILSVMSAASGFFGLILLYLALRKSAFRKSYSVRTNGGSSQ
jgi:hypothetical protein